jgi:opacity protein-like surface antigen
MFLTIRRAAIVGALLLAIATPARADITAFLGTNVTPDNRPTRGFALGITVIIVGFEFEYSNTSDSTNPATLAPSLKTGTANLLLQTPVAIAGFQPYFTTGAGIYSETLGAHSDTSFSLNTGGGVKINLVGPLRLRVDYRVFKLGSGALYSPAHRIYAGLNIKL